MTLLFLNHPLISTAGGAVHLKPAIILRDKSLLTCHFLRVLVSVPLKISSLCTFSLQPSTPFSLTGPPSMFSAALPQHQPNLHICQYFPSLPSYLRRRCWSLAEIWRSQKWSVAGPWSFHTGRRLRARVCLNPWVEPEAGQSCRFLLSEGSHGDPQGGRNGKWTGHLERVTEDDYMNYHS